MERDLVLVTWDGESTKPSKIEKLHEVDKGTGNVFNDGKADPSGRLWIGRTLFEPDNLLQSKKSTFNFSMKFK